MKVPMLAIIAAAAQYAFAAPIAQELPGNDPGVGIFPCIKGYLIQKDDTCWALAQKYSGGDVQKFKAWNYPTTMNCDNLEIGLKICVGIAPGA